MSQIPDSQGPAAPPAAPPTQQGPLSVPSRRPTWPMVLGVIAIFFGACATLMGIWTIVSPFVMGDFLNAFAPQQAALTEKWAPLTVVSGVAITVLALLLIFGGIGLVRRRQTGVRMCSIWAVAKMVLVIFNTLSGIVLQQETISAMATNPASPTGPPQGVILGFMLIMLAIVLAWGWALPVFMLIWFRLRKVKEHIATWQ